MKKVFIDGREGTTGLRIYERLQGRKDLQLLLLSEEERKNTKERKKCINIADYVFLCLPDEAAVESVSLCENDKTVIIDASTAHRTVEGWSYGLPELSTEHRRKIENSNRIAVPGCFASGFNALVYPLIANDMIDRNYPLNCFAVSGYSGGGKKMIAEYENENRAPELSSPRQYALTQQHKHLREMKHASKLEAEPVFIPLVDDFYSGMQVTVPIMPRLLKKKLTQNEIHDFFSAYYNSSRMIKVQAISENGLYMAANSLAANDGMRINICGNDERILLIATFDNLGKGASGAAVQCMNIRMGIDEGTGLFL